MPSITAVSKAGRRGSYVAVQHPAYWRTVPSDSTIWLFVPRKAGRP